MEYYSASEGNVKQFLAGGATHNRPVATQSRSDNAVRKVNWWRSKRRMVFLTISVVPYITMKGSPSSALMITFTALACSPNRAFSLLKTARSLFECSVQTTVTPARAALRAS